MIGKNIRIYKVNEVLSELEFCINKKRPFSLIRFGDGGIKLMHSVLYDNKDRLLNIIQKEGLPPEKIFSIFYLWGKSARNANFIDCPEIYFTKEFWPRFTREDIIPVIKDWKNIYINSEFDNDKFVNPEIHFLSILKGVYKKNLIDIIRGKKIFCVTNYPQVRGDLKKNSEVRMYNIVGFFKNQYKEDYKRMTKIIKKEANKCDLWLVGAGELGRIYSGLIKQYGGRAFDLGSVFDCWAGSVIPKRLKNYIYKPSKHSLEFRLTDYGKKYKKFL